MLEIKNAVLPSPEQWEFVIRGMRNPLNSWEKSDSGYCYGEYYYTGNKTSWCNTSCPYYEIDHCKVNWTTSVNKEDYIDATDYCYNRGECTYILGQKDLTLAQNLVKSGTEHAKFLRQLPVIFDIKAPLYWWKQCDQYKVGTVTDSCSTMHKLTDKEFKLEDFSFDYAEDLLESIECPDDIPYYNVSPKIMTEQLVNALNVIRDKYLKTKDKKYWHTINEVLPQSYNQLRTWSANYAVLFNICSQRANHPLSEWNTFIKWVVDNVPYFRELCFDKLCKVSKPFRELFNE